MICILCGYVKHHVITEPKNSLAPPSGRYLTELKVHELNMPTEFHYDKFLLTLSNKFSNFIGRCRPCFLRYSNVLIDPYGTLDKDTAYQFSSRSDKRLHSYSCFYVFYYYSATKW